MTLRELFMTYGTDPAIGACFARQDWWFGHAFAERPAKAVFPAIPGVRDDLRAQDPEWIAGKYQLPHAVDLALAFFTYWRATGKLLWTTDYLWSCDHDDKGDRVFVGGYTLGTGGRDGFAIHRRLTITADYTAIVLEGTHDARYRPSATRE